MPNEISAETREADARWCESTAFGRDTEHDHSDLERCTGCQRINRLAELSRAAVKLEQVIEEYDSFNAGDGRPLTSVTFADLLAEYQRAIFVVDAAREVVGGGA